MSDQTSTLLDDDTVDDAPYGQVMLIVFATAVVLVSLAVGLLALSTTWWMLGVVCGIHLTATVIVSITIARALSGRAGRSGRTERARAEASAAVEVPAAGSFVAAV